MYVLYSKRCAFKKVSLYNHSFRYEKCVCPWRLSCKICKVVLAHIVFIVVVDWINLRRVFWLRTSEDTVLTSHNTAIYAWCSTIRTVLLIWVDSAMYEFHILNTQVWEFYSMKFWKYYWIRFLSFFLWWLNKYLKISR